jgi:ubiquitin-protein ligase
MARIYMDALSARHVSQRIKQRISSEQDRVKIVQTVKKLLKMEAPAEALGHYQWHINVQRIARIVFRGHTIRTVYSFHENYPNSTEYEIRGQGIVRA